MMDLVMRRTQQQAAEFSRKGDPELGMLQLHDGIDEDDQNYIIAVDLEYADLYARRVIDEAHDRPDANGDDIDEDQAVEGMNAERGQRRQNFRRMMRLVQFPQERDFVLEIVVEPIAELI